MLQTITEEQRKNVENILEPISYWESYDGSGIHIDDFVSYDKLAELVDYLRSINNPKRYRLDLHIVSPNMLGVVETWLAYKKEKGKIYKPIGFKSFYKKLCELSCNNPQTAMAIIEQSMASNYDGIFPLRNNNQYGRAKTNTEKFYESIAEANEFSKKLREHIGEPTVIRDGDTDEVW